MSSYSKVCWNEGMFLRPQHFQQQDRFHLENTHRKLSCYQPYGWGVLVYDIDQEALALGQFSLQKIQAVFKDGTYVDLPHLDDLPPSLPVPLDTKDELIHLCIALDQPYANNIGEYSTEKLTRYFFEDHALVDNTQSMSQEEVIQLAKLRVRYRIGTAESLSGFVSLPVARIINVSEEDGVQLDNEFIPPHLSVQQNKVMYQWLQELLGKVRQRANAISLRISVGQGEASSLSDYLMLQIVNRMEMQLSHLLQVKGTHPEQLYQLLVGFAGELSSLTSANYRPTLTPAYRHEQIEGCFGDLIAVFSQALSEVFESPATRLLLDDRGYGVHVTELADPQMLSQGEFVLAVKAQVADEELRRYLPSRVKIGAVEHIRELVNNQLPGIEIDVLPVAPRQIPFHAGFHYFQLNKQSLQWSQLLNSGGLAVHLSGQYPGLEMEIWVIKS